MEFVDYKTKSQKVSSLLQQAKCPEDLLNCKEIELENDFQYICINSGVNTQVVGEIIAILAQNGNKKIIEDNIKSISIGLWNDVFNRNKFINEIFSENFDEIIESAGIVTYRDIEKFLNDENTKNILYSNMELIVKKLCTYDRASLITDFSKSAEGIEAIKSNIELFFQKGEYDISTTYSKIVAELSNVPGLNKQIILEACSNYLTEMIERETAVDNETNTLLNWIYDAFEECHMDENARTELQSKIDKAIVENFDNILDKTNYDRETIKILKLFSCTHGRFKNNKNMFIENSSKLLHMTKIYDLNYEKESKMGDDVQILKNEDSTVDEQAQDEVGNKDVQENRINEFDNVFKEEIDTINEYASLLEESGNGGETKDIIESLVKSNLYETDKIIDKIVNKDDIKIWDKSSMKADALQDDNGCTKVYKVTELMKTTMNYGKEGVVEQASTNIEEHEDNYSFSRNVKEENALIVGNKQTIKFKKVIKAVKGFFRKVKLVLTKYKSERIGE